MILGSKTSFNTPVDQSVGKDSTVLYNFELEFSQSNIMALASASQRGTQSCFARALPFQPWPLSLDWIPGQGMQDACFAVLAAPLSSPLCSLTAARARNLGFDLFPAIPSEKFHHQRVIPFDAKF